MENNKIEIESLKSELKLKEKHNEELKSKLSEKTAEVKTILAQNVELQEKIVKTNSEQSSVEEDLRNNLAQAKATNSQMKEEKESILKELHDKQEKDKLRIIDLEHELGALRQHSETYSQEKFEALTNQLSSCQSQLENSVLEREKSILHYEQLKIKFDQLQHELRGKVAELDATHESQEELKSDLSSTKSVADKRKVLIDEMALEIQNKTDEIQQINKDFSGKIESLETESKHQANELQAAIKSVTKEKNDLEKWPKMHKDLENKLKDQELVRTDLESKLEDLKRKLLDLADDHEGRMKHLQTEFEKERESWKEEASNLQKEADLKLELANVQKTEFEESVQRLEQDIKDNLEDRKISEKKGQALVKDLKRQLQQERNKNEKLQEKMKECFETGSNTSEPLRADAEGDRTSVSSWSLMSGHNDRDTATSTPSKLSPSPLHSR